MSRITRKDLDRAFSLFANLHGYSVGYGNGQIYLDYMNPGDGGSYIVEMIANDARAVYDIFGSRRRTAREMYECLIFANEIAYHRDSPRYKSILAMDS